MPDVIEDTTNSIRWVTAQWKQEPLSDVYQQEFGNEWGPSPFLAQRFDDGILHVTVQDEHCRCIVASAPNSREPNATWVDDKPRRCESTRPGDPIGTTCESTLRVKYGDSPELTSPRGRWVEMKYRVQASRSKEGAKISVYQDGRFIVSVEGSIGYQPSSKEQPMTKFKIGHYRDYEPFAHAMDIDWVRVKKVE
jgi:hypothetical protein